MNMVEKIDDKGEHSSDDGLEFCGQEGQEADQAEKPSIKELIGQKQSFADKFGGANTAAVAVDIDKRRKFA